jgi:hypothetical protein
VPAVAGSFLLTPQYGAFLSARHHPGAQGLWIPLAEVLITKEIDFWPDYCCDWSDHFQE